MCYFIIFPSITYAQRAEDLLAHRGVISHMVRTPSEIGASACSYALRICDANYRRALEILNIARIPYKKVISYDGTYREVGR